MDDKSILQRYRKFYILNGIAYLFFFTICFRYFIYIIRAMFNSSGIDIFNLFIYLIVAIAVLFLIALSFINRLRRKISNFEIIDLLLAGAIYYIFFDQLGYLIYASLFMAIIIVIGFIFYLMWLISLFGGSPLTNYFNRSHL